MRPAHHIPILAVATVLLSMPPARAQNIDRAVRAYNADDYETAAFLFHDVKENARKADDRIKAEYYLGHALYKGGYYLPAFQFYGEVFTAGASHPYFLKATRGLLNVARAIRDDARVPELVSQGYGNAFAQLDAASLNTINYMIGVIAQRQGNYVEAKQFLGAVTDRSDDALEARDRPPGDARRVRRRSFGDVCDVRHRSFGDVFEARHRSDDYFKARYRLGILAVRAATEQGAGDYSRAIGYFTELETRLARATDDARRKLLRLALLGKARAYYSQGDFAKSVEYYEKVPRFSEDWYDAMFESGWAYFQNAQFGRALGMVHSIQSPYFDDRYRAESWVLKATTYFQMCHFDRVRRALDVFFSRYEPMAAQLKPWLRARQTNAELVEVIEQGHPAFPPEIRRQVANNRRYRKLSGQIDELGRELAAAGKCFPEGTFKAQLMRFLRDERDQLTDYAGRVVRAELLRREAVYLDDFLNQARIIKFETADAERKMLEAGKDITKGPRAKGPRPVVPNARFQYWAFQGEYWLDELGYYAHSIKNECVDEVFR